MTATVSKTSASVGPYTQELGVNIDVTPQQKVGLRAGTGTRVFTVAGHEIKDITSITISMEPDEILYATIVVPVNKLT